MVVCTVRVVVVLVVRVRGCSHLRCSRMVMAKEGRVRVVSVVVAFQVCVSVCGEMVNYDVCVCEKSLGKMNGIKVR